MGSKAEPQKRSFLTVIQEIRRRARQHIQDGAGYRQLKGLLFLINGT
jgi:hypothetical protein